MIALLRRLRKKQQNSVVGLLNRDEKNQGLSAPVTFTILSMLIAITSSFNAFADNELTTDHPLLSRYQGVPYFKHHFFDYIGLDIPIGTIDDRRSDNNVLHVVGKASFITYRLPKQTSQLEVVKTLKAKITQSEFEVIFECEESDDFKHNSCGKQMHRFAGSERAKNGFQFNYGLGQRVIQSTVI